MQLNDVLKEFMFEIKRKRTFGQANSWQYYPVCASISNYKRAIAGLCKNYRKKFAGS